MEMQIVKVEETQLDEVVKNSGIAINEATEIKAAYLPFLSELARVQSGAGDIDFKTPGANDEIKARELRLATVKIRTGAEKQKDDRKKMYLLRGNMEQASYNLIATACKMTEEVFMNVEKAREIAEKARKEQLKQERISLISPYIEDVNTYMLGEMTEQGFETLLAGAKSQYEARKEAERKAEEERIAKQKADEAERETQRLENIRLKAEAEERERLAEIERKKQADILAKQKAEADKREAELKAKADAERKERERLADELEAKKQAEEKAKKVAAAAEKKAKLAPDKDKLLLFAQLINDLPRPDVKSIEAADIASKANIMLVQAANYIRDNANKL